jgi:hypothetical protein
VPNAYRGELEVELGGETRRFRFSLNKLANMEEKMGVTSITELAGNLNDLGFAQLRYLLWLGVNEYDAESKTWVGPTEHEVGEWELDLDTLAETLKLALMRAFRGGGAGDGEDEEEEATSTADPQKEEATITG